MQGRQRCIHFEKHAAYSVEMSMNSPKLPFGDSYQVLSRICISHVSAGKTRMRVTNRVEILKKNILKAPPRDSRAGANEPPGGGREHRASDARADDLVLGHERLPALRGRVTDPAAGELDCAAGKGRDPDPAGAQVASRVAGARVASAEPRGTRVDDDGDVCPAAGDTTDVRPGGVGARISPGRAARFAADVHDAAHPVSDRQKTAPGAGIAACDPCDRRAAASDPTPRQRPARVPPDRRRSGHGRSRVHYLAAERRLDRRYQSQDRPHSSVSSRAGEVTVLVGAMCMLPLPYSPWTSASSADLTHLSNVLNSRTRSALSRMQSSIRETHQRVASMQERLGTVELQIVAALGGEDEAGKEEERRAERRKLVEQVLALLHDGPPPLDKKEDVPMGADGEGRGVVETKEDAGGVKEDAGVVV
ncbi:hypothetical protein BDK51DRAFT_49102 [Blyttiomyces helicus]|uniref:VASt domain-containing protein n=1 Tax=Blyttiomyces helicus TaxID=388810 RepID=A0A4P9W010_9FUNG|nr:hypothetical protein BDK51DRAFT_49102 [Blyttiomyces helicus]|eukprot:RKO84403.1 hypothetical protein BDK51DRAFT_49102 [Blyttiomyces helicus]